MNVLTKKDIHKTVAHFGYVMGYVKIPTNEEENQQLIVFANELKKIANRDSRAARLLDLVINNIELYERRAYPLEPLGAAEMLAYLMEQHDLTQSDLPELGSQPHVSKILSGERNLTKDQIGALAKRFGVSPAVFYNE